MVIILPNEINDLSDVEKKLHNISVTNILSQGHGEEMRLWLPKFKVESNIDLRNVLIEVYTYLYSVTRVKITISYILIPILCRWV